MFWVKLLDPFPLIRQTQIPGLQYEYHVPARNYKKIEDIEVSGIPRHPKDR